jgi:uncharacterized protein YecE (DUF72 family)
MQLYLGCPIWSFKGWVGNFYPSGTKPADYLLEYARRLTAIEGNTTFYAVPGKAKLGQWVAQTPDTFRFCPKVPRDVSHAGKLVEHIDAALQFVEIMSQLGNRLGPMFLQLPPRYSPAMFEDLRAFVEAWPRQVRLGVEVRHIAWFESGRHETLNRLLAAHNMARVVIDTRPIRSLDGDKILEGSVYQTLLEARERKPDVPILRKRMADFSFLRYIGHPQMKVNTPLLDEWGTYLASELRQGSDVYVFCHSPDNLLAPWLCREFHMRIASQVNILPLPWDEIQANTFEQGRLF